MNTTKTIKEFPTLYCLSKTGKTKVYKSKIVQGNNSFILIREHGQIDGKLTNNEKVIASEEKAISEAQSLFDKKVKARYTADINTLNQTDLVYPMLALEYKKHRDKVIFPCLVQPKIDGIRVTITRKKNGNYTEILYRSRSCNTFTTLTHFNPFINYLLDQLPEETILDGEIYTPEFSFEEIVGMVRRDQPSIEATKLELYLFDIITKDRNLTFEKRQNLLRNAIEKLDKATDSPFDVCNSIGFVRAFEVRTHEAIQKYHDKFVGQGYEGVIIRNKESLYLQNFRSQDLLKYKQFIEEEYKIVGGKSGEGLDQDCVTFICQTKDGKTFECKPKGSRELRKKWLEEIDQIIDKKLTVKYQNLTNDNIPRFPVGKAIRDYD